MSVPNVVRVVNGNQLTPRPQLPRRSARPDHNHAVAMLYSRIPSTSVVMANVDAITLQRESRHREYHITRATGVAIRRNSPS